MPLAILVVDRDAALQEGGQPGRIKRRVAAFDREQGLGLIEQEAPIAIGAGDHRLARLRR